MYASAGCTAPVNNATCPGLPEATCKVADLVDCNVTLLMDREDVMDKLEGKTHCDVVNGTAMMLQLFGVVPILRTKSED